MEEQKKQMQKEFLKQICPDMHFSLLFENLPGILFFVKDTKGRLIMGNKLFVHHCGLETQEELIGKDDYDIFPPELAEQCYSAQIQIQRIFQGLQL